MNARFPVGGEKQAVFNFLRDNGFVMVGFGDKQWHRADGLKLHIYGTGSMARIFDKDGRLIADEAIDTAVDKVRIKGS